MMHYNVQVEVMTLMFVISVTLSLIIRSDVILWKYYLLCLSHEILSLGCRWRKNVVVMAIMMSFINDDKKDPIVDADSNGDIF